MSTIAEMRSLNRYNPVLLFEIELLNSGGTVYFSDRNILVGAQHYQDYILNATDIQDAVQRDTSQGDNPAVMITFNNKAFRAYANLSVIENTYPISGAKVTIKEIGLDDDNNQSSDFATPFVGVFEEIRNEKRLSFDVTAMSIKVNNSLKSIGRI